MFPAQKILLDITTTQRQAQNDKRHMKMAPAGVTTFGICTYVLMDPSIHTLKGNPSGKFTPRLLGPYLIVNRVCDKYYSSCRNLVDDAVKNYHVTQLASTIQL